MLPLLRNYRYTVNITSVEGRGDEEMEQAYFSNSPNLKAEIYQHSDPALTNVMYDGQYYIAWDPGEFEFTRETRDSMIR